jgi:Protein of unknown function (DUF2637)
MKADAVAVLNRSALARRVSWGITLLAVAGLLGIIGVTFVTSFEAVSEVAVERGVVARDLAWAIPIAIDGLIVVGSAVAWLESLRAERWHLGPIAVVAVAGVLSVVANIAHAGNDDWLARALAATPPAGLIVAVELLAWETRRAVRRSLGIDQAGEPGEAVPVVAEAEPVAVDPSEFGPRAATPELLDRIGPPAANGNGRRKTSGRVPTSRVITWADVEALAPDQRTSERAVQAALDTSRHQVRKLVEQDSDRWRTLVSRS